MSMAIARWVGLLGAILALGLWAYIGAVDRRKRTLAIGACVWMLVTALYHAVLIWPSPFVTHELRNAWNITLRLYVIFLLAGEGIALALRTRCHKG